MKSKILGDAGSFGFVRVFVVAGWRMRPERKEGTQWFMAVIVVLGREFRRLSHGWFLICVSTFHVLN